MFSANAPVSGTKIYIDTASLVTRLFHRTHGSSYLSLSLIMSSRLVLPSRYSIRAVHA